MSIKKIKHFWKQNNNTGFSSNATETLGGRFVNKDGSYNLVKEGIPFWKRISIFHDMLHLKLWKFIAVILIFFVLINLIFTSIYFIIGISGFQGIQSANNWQLFKELYYFSTETFTTVGYGRVNPANDAANIISGIESLAGLSSLAIATGLIYGRFSMPRSYLIFSEHALVSPYKNTTGLMFRFASYKDMHTLTDVDVKINVGMKVLDGETETYKYFALDLERSRAESMPMSWTVVHPINEDSPFFGFKEEDMKQADVELYVMLRGFDDVFSNYVHRRTSYTYNEILFNRKFIPMYRENETGTTTILELHKLNMHNNVSI
ncbi:MAG: transporter [Bacteroidetes bacterium]|nr:transporter [Bacteroidota bacterium]MBS1591648.1 transporter [Bacteroidota bacterium]MBS1639329.1 transporter [Bacteroidota bacterium]